MCNIILGDFEPTPEDLIVYKVVRKTNKLGVFVSEFSPYGRSMIEPSGGVLTKASLRYKNEGKELIYRYGIATKSSTTKSPGVMAYTEIPRRHYLDSCDTILKCKIPRGALVRFGITTYSAPLAIMTSSLIPLEKAAY